MAAIDATRPRADEPPPLEVTVDLIAFDVSIADLERASVQTLVEWVLSAEEQRGKWSINVVLVDDEHLRSLHRAFMGIDEATDVMTFPFDPDDEQVGGEIVVSIERATEQGPSHDHSPMVEVQFLVTHGLLHLCGWDDATLGDRERMLARQTELLQELERRGTEGVDGQ